MNPLDMVDPRFDAENCISKLRQLLSTDAGKCVAKVVKA